MLAGTFAGASAAAVTGSSRVGLGAAVATAVDFSRWCTVSPRSPIAATRSSSASPSVSSLPRSTIILSQAWFRQGACRRSPKTRASRRSFCPARSGARRAGARAGLFRADLGPSAAGLSRVPDGAIHLVDAVSHPLRPKASRRRRKSGRRRYHRHFGDLPALPRGIFTGVLAGKAGAYLSLAQNAGFVKDMTAGEGFIALAALIVAKWKPVPAMFACLAKIAMARR